MKLIYIQKNEYKDEKGNIFKVVSKIQKNRKYEIILTCVNDTTKSFKTEDASFDMGYIASNFGADTEKSI